MWRSYVLSLSDLAFSRTKKEQKNMYSALVVYRYPVSSRHLGERRPSLPVSEQPSARRIHYQYISLNKKYFLQLCYERKDNISHCLLFYRAVTLLSCHLCESSGWFTFYMCHTTTILTCITVSTAVRSRGDSLRKSFVVVRSHQSGLGGMCTQILLLHLFIGGSFSKDSS